MADPITTAAAMREAASALQSWLDGDRTACPEDAVEVAVAVLRREERGVPWMSMMKPRNGKQVEPIFTLAWSMPNRWTFEMAPVRAFLERWLADCHVVVDPFSGKSVLGTIRNDLADGGIDAVAFCEGLLAEHMGQCDAVLFDPPYSPRQISECYKSIGRKAMMADTQNAALYARVLKPMAALLKPGGIALSFGWQSAGFGKLWPTHEILLVRHGGAHNDTICVAQKKPEGA